MNRIGDNFIGCRFNSIQFWKKIIEVICFSIRCMTMNRRRLVEIDEFQLCILNMMNLDSGVSICLSLSV